MYMNTYIHTYIHTYIYIYTVLNTKPYELLLNIKLVYHYLRLIYQRVEVHHKLISFLQLIYNSIKQHCIELVYHRMQLVY